MVFILREFDDLEWPSTSSFTYCKSFQTWFFVQWCSSSRQDFSWHSSSRGSSVTTELLVCHRKCHDDVIIRLETRHQPNIGFTLRRDLAVFTRSAITPLKLNRFGWNLERSEYIVGGGGGVAMADFGRDPHRSDSWRARQNLIFLSGMQRTVSPKFHEICTRHFDRWGDENFRNRILNILP